MARFTKEEMLDELRTIFLFEADHIALGKGMEFAEAFIGYTVGNAGEFLHDDPKLVDLDKFEITKTLSRGYDFAFRPSVISICGTDEVQDLAAFMLGTPRGGGIASAGELHSFMTPDGMCRQVAEAVQARWKLDLDHGYTFSTRELALLSDMTEGAVRNALADKGEGGLKAIGGSKPVSVDHAEAVRWLNGRRGFVPTPTQPLDDRFLLENIKAAETTERLSHLLRRVIAEQFQQKSEVCETAKCSEADLASWCDGSFIFDHDLAARLATAIGLDVPAFVGKALETTLRRDQGRSQ